MAHRECAYYPESWFVPAWQRAPLGTVVARVVEPRRSGLSPSTLTEQRASQRVPLEQRASEGVPLTEERAPQGVPLAEQRASQRVPARQRAEDRVGERADHEHNEPERLLRLLLVGLPGSLLLERV